jgi:hypothetical protein
VGGGIEPSPEEIVIAIRNTFDGSEEFYSSIIVPFGLDFGFQGKPSNMETSISSPFNPLLIGVQLDTSSGPVPTGLGFGNVEFTVNTDSHSTMADVTATSVTNDGIKTIESNNGQEITGVDEGFIEFDNNILRSDLPSVVHSFTQEFNVLFFHERSGLASEERNIGVKAQTTDEKPEGLEQIRNEVDTLVADSEKRDTDSFEDFILFISELESDLVSTMSGKNFNVEVGQGGVEIGVGTQERFACLELVDNFNGVLVNNIKGDGSILEALGAVTQSGVFEGKGAGEDGSHLEEVTLFIIIAGHKSVIFQSSVFFLIMFSMDQIVVQFFPMFFRTEKTLDGEFNKGFLTVFGLSFVISGTKIVGSASPDAIVGINLDGFRRNFTVKVFISINRSGGFVISGEIERPTRSSKGCGNNQNKEQ